MIRVTVQGQDRLARKLKRLAREQHAGLGRAVGTSLAGLEREAKRRLERADPARGKSLAESVFRKRDRDGLGGAVGTADPRAAAIERRRPWLKPALAAERPKIRRRLAGAVKAANRKVAK